MTLQWLTIAIVSGSVAILGYFGRLLLSRFDKLISEVQGLREVTVSQDAKIGENKRSIDDHKNRLDNHSERLRNVEIQQAKRAG